MMNGRRQVVTVSRSRKDGGDEGWDEDYEHETDLLDDLESKEDWVDPNDEQNGPEEDRK